MLRRLRAAPPSWSKPELFDEPPSRTFPVQGGGFAVGGGALVVGCADRFHRPLTPTWAFRAGLTDSAAICLGSVGDLFTRAVGLGEQIPSRVGNVFILPRSEKSTNGSVHRRVNQFWVGEPGPSDTLRRPFAPTWADRARLTDSAAIRQRGRLGGDWEETGRRARTQPEISTFQRVLLV